MAYKTGDVFPDFMACSINIRYMALPDYFVDKNHVKANLIRNQPIQPSISKAIQENVIFEKTLVLFD